MSINGRWPAITFQNLGGRSALISARRKPGVVRASIPSFRSVHAAGAGYRVSLANLARGQQAENYSGGNRMPSPGGWYAASPGLRRVCCLGSGPILFDHFLGRGLRGSRPSSVEGHLYSGAENVRYLVDSASSHMLVSKIKPCMSKYKQFIL